MFMLLSGISIPGFSQHLIKGSVIDKITKEPIEFVSIFTGQNTNTVISNKQGKFRIHVQSDSITIYASMIGYVPAKRNILKDSFIVIELEHGRVDLKDVRIYAQTNNASFHSISSIDMNLRPVNSAQDLMKLVPGLFLGQHHGGGIAEHIFFRGFDADHGTDVNVSVDGMPINLVSHAHGQGFSDLHFLIPELAKNYEFGKGPYYADHGDFTTAGYVAFNTYDVLEKSMIKLEGGQFNTGRAVGMFNLLSDKARLKNESAYIAGEAAYTDGPFDWAQHFKRLNLFGKYNTYISPETKMLVTLSTFSSAWRSSGEIPQRAVAEGLTDRFGYIDSLQGGNTSRSNAIVKFTTTLSDKSGLENQVYYSHYKFEHHYNDTFFAEDSVNGDELMQKESRDIIGYNGKFTNHSSLKNGMDLLSSIGVGSQLNKIYNSQLSHMVDINTLLDYFQLGNVNEYSLNTYVDENLKFGKWLINFGARFDYLNFAYEDKLNPVQPSRGKAIVSPKLNLEYTPNAKIQWYIKTGKGFHSNDAKVVVSNQGRDILPAAYGADIEMNWKPIPHLFINTALWYLYLKQEFVYNADDGTMDPGDKSGRAGIDISARYQFNKWLFARVDINYARARDLQAPVGDNYLPLAVPLSSTGGFDFKFANGINGGISYRYMSDRPANADNSLVAKGYFVTDLTANYTQKKYEIGLEIQNLLNTKWREEQFEVVSRLKNEKAPVDDINFTSGTPFFAKLKFAIFF